MNAIWGQSSASFELAPAERDSQQAAGLLKLDRDAVTNKLINIRTGSYQHPQTLDPRHGRSLFQPLACGSERSLLFSTPLRMANR